MIRIRTQKKVLYNLGNIFKMNTFSTVLPRAVFRTQKSMAHYFAGYSFVVIVLDRFFSFGSQKKRLLVALDSNH